MPPTFAYTCPCSRPAASQTIRSCAGIVKKQVRTTMKMSGGVLVSLVAH